MRKIQNYNSEDKINVSKSKLQKYEQQKMNIIDMVDKKLNEKESIYKSK